MVVYQLLFYVRIQLSIPKGSYFIADPFIVILKLFLLDVASQYTHVCSIVFQSISSCDLPFKENTWSKISVPTIFRRYLTFRRFGLEEIFRSSSKCLNLHCLVTCSRSYSIKSKFTCFWGARLAHFAIVHRAEKHVSWVLNFGLNFKQNCVRMKFLEFLVACYERYEIALMIFFIF